MTIKNNLQISSISWLSTLRGAVVDSFYEPQEINELVNLCRGFYSDGLSFDLVGHTSNTLYTSDYRCERMVSTRKLTQFEILTDRIVCHCGTSVRSLSLAAIEQGIKGFEGLTDLPGTVGASLYGNAGCYGCSLASLLIEATVLTANGEVQTVFPEWFGFTHRSSVLKRKEKNAIILTATFHRENGDTEDLKAIAQNNHAKRRATQPEPKNSLGSIFAISGRPTLLNRFLNIITKLYAFVLQLGGDNKQIIVQKRKHLLFALLNARNIEPYVRTWNWYQWKDSASHELFWKYVKIHKLMFTKSEFEIEIKHNKNHIIP